MMHMLYKTFRREYMDIKRYMIKDTNEIQLNKLDPDDTGNFKSKKKQKPKQSS